MKTSSIHPLLGPLITVVSVAGVLYLLVAFKALFIPLALAFLLAFFLLPMVSKMERKGVPRILAILGMIVISLAFMACAGLLLWFAVSQFVKDIPAYQGAAMANLASMQSFVERVLRVPVETQQLWFSENVNLLEIAANNAGAIATRIGAVGTTMSLMFIYSFFILYYRDKAMTFFQKLFGVHDELVILETLKKLSRIVPKYLSGVIWVMVILGIVNSLGFWAIGVPNPVFFGIVAAVLNVIPYVGPVIGFGLVVLFSLATAGPAVAIAAVVMFLIVQFLENNILTPQIAGSSININPFVAIVAIVIGGSLWGVVGMIIALPFVGMLKTVCDSHPKLEPYGYLLGDEGTERHALSWANVKKTFARFSFKKKH